MTKIDPQPAQLGLVFATILRPHVAQRLIESVRRFFPDMPIYVADQTHRTPQQQAFYDKTGCKVAWLDHDAGVCASRNAAVAMVKEPYFVLCDDDFIFTHETDFSRALTVLEAERGIGVVGGRLFDIYQNPATGEISRHARFWELQLHFDPKKRQLMTIPVHYFAPDPKYAGDVGYYECDAVMNFAVFRTAIFDETVRWDPRFKSNGEHEDFYLNLKVNSDYRVAYIPEIVAEHHHPPLRGYSRMRNRSKGWQIFLDKWDLRQIVDLDGVLRVSGSVQEMQPYAMGYESFYSSLPLLSRKREQHESTMQVSNVNGQVGSVWRKEVLKGKTAPTRNRGLFRIYNDVKMVESGGLWSYPDLAYSKRHSATARPAISRIDAVEWRLEVPEIDKRRSTDRFAYLMPSLDEAADDTPRFCSFGDVEFRVSLAQDGVYAVYLAPVQIYGQALMLNSWNALMIPAANLSGDLVLEVSVINDSVILCEVAETLKETV